MDTTRLLFASTVAALTGLAGTAAHAQPLTFRETPVAQAAAQVGAKYGVGINLAGLGGVRVTFTVEDADAPGARLLAVNALANAAGADFLKTFVIGRAADGAGVAGARVDAATSLPSSQQAYPARDAIAMVAGLDDAAVRFTDAVDGTVTLTGASLTVSQAAAQIAQQTHTRWGTVYTLQPRLAGRALGGTVIGRTAGGSPIVQLASVYYHDAAWTAHQQRIEEAERLQALAEQQAALAGQAAEAAAARQAAANGRQNGTTPAANPYAPIIIGGQSDGTPITNGGY